MGTPVDFDVCCVTIDDSAMTGHDRVRERVSGLENPVAALKLQLEKTEAHLSTATAEKAQLLDWLSVSEKAEKRVIQAEKRALMPPVDEQKPKHRNSLLRNPFGAREAVPSIQKSACLFLVYLLNS